MSQTCLRSRQVFLGFFKKDLPSFEDEYKLIEFIGRL